MIEAALSHMGLVLPEPAVPRYAYVPVVVEGGLAWVSGQLPWRDGALAASGRLGESVTVEQAQEAARCCVLQGLAVLRQALGGDLSRVKRVVKLVGFVASAPGFQEQPRVVDAASELLQAIMGPAGRHARSAVGVAALPRGAAIEVEFVFAVAPA